MNDKTKNIEVPINLFNDTLEARIHMMQVLKDFCCVMDTMRNNNATVNDIISVFARSGVLISEEAIKSFPERLTESELN